jgi:DNA invertase Pin-like site-specific DNA recombinase
MIIGYARTSTVEQAAGIEAQQRDLVAAKCEKVFAEQISSVATRPQFEAAIEFCRDGDLLVVTKMDRLARNVADLLAIVARLEAKGVGLLVLSMGGQPIDTRTATGKFTLTMLGAVAEFERTLMLERQKEGISKAKDEGKYKGRAPTVAKQADEMRRLLADGVKPAEIARRMGVARSSVYRVIDPAAAARDAA